MRVLCAASDATMKTCPLRRVLKYIESDLKNLLVPRTNETERLQARPTTEHLLLLAEPVALQIVYDNA